MKYFADIIRKNLRNTESVYYGRSSLRNLAILELGELRTKGPSYRTRIGGGGGGGGDFQNVEVRNIAPFGLDELRTKGSS